MSSLNPGTVRTTGFGALAVAVLYAVSIPAGSLASAPGADASATVVLGFLTAHQDGILAAVVMNGIAWCALMPAVFVGLRQVFGAESREAMNVALMGAAVESATLIGVILIFAALAAFAAPGLGAPAAKLLSDGYQIATVAASWPTLTCVLGLVAAARRSRVLPTTVVLMGLLVAVAHVFGGLGVARVGAFAPSGIALLAAPLFAAWMAIIGVSLLRRATHLAIVGTAAA